MKNILCLLIIIPFLGCKSQEQIIPTKSISKESNLTEIESNIVNDFLYSELSLDMYKNYKNYEYIIIKEAYKKTTSLFAYEYTYQNSYKHDKQIKNYWLLDSLQIEKIKLSLKNEEVYHWKVIDFKNFKVNIQKQEDFKKTTKKDEYLYLPHRLIIFLSKPLIINKYSALISIDINNGDLGSSNISHFTVSMKKENGKWIKDKYYEDGVFY